MQVGGVGAGAVAMAMPTFASQPAAAPIDEQPVSMETQAAVLAAATATSAPPNAATIATMQALAGLPGAV